MFLDNFQDLNSKKVFYFFNEISKIPHGSGNTKNISDYIKNFAIGKKLEYYQDELNNIIVYKPGGNLLKNKDTLILQSHIDMVCDKEEGSLKNMDIEGIDLAIDGDYLYAEETSLGADDGIAVAMVLGILDDVSLSHPPIEAVFTSDEEIGLIGAKGLDMSKLQGKFLINLDSEEEGVMVVSCAGGNRLDIEIPILRETCNDLTNLNLINISIKGLKGGHSGLKIDKGLANANKLLTLLLKEIKDNFDSIKLINLSGGNLDNAIANFGEFSILATDFDCINSVSKRFNKKISEEYEGIEDNISIEVSLLDYEECSKYPISDDSLDKIINFILEMPNGVQKMDDIEGLVETSLNLGIINLTQDNLNVTSAIRSSSSGDKCELNDYISLIAEKYGGKTQIKGSYPAWEFNPNSELSKFISNEYELLYNRPMKLNIIHAGLECGLFVDGIKGLDAVSIGPTMLNVHSYDEKVSISSVDRTYNLLLNVLKHF